MDYIPQHLGLPYSLGQAMAHVAETVQFHEELMAQRRQLEQTVQELHRRNAELQSFYHILSHELKTPLTAAREFVSIVLDGLAGPLSEPQREYLSVVKDSCDQITLGLNDLLDSTRVDTGKLSIAPRPTPMARVVSQVVAALASAAYGKGVRLQQVVAPQLPDALIDERRIAQVLVNLLSNALKFTPAGGGDHHSGRRRPTAAGRHVRVGQRYRSWDSAGEIRPGVRSALSDPPGRRDGARRVGAGSVH
jgi:signal transduction histidine kinase